MRLFEIFEFDETKADMIEFLRVLQGMANKANQSLSIPYNDIVPLLNKSKIGVGSKEGLKQLINAADPSGQIATINDDGTVILTTNVKNPEQQQPAELGATSSSIDSMARSNAKTLSK